MNLGMIRIHIEEISTVLMLRFSVCKCVSNITCRAAFGLFHFFLDCSPAVQRQCLNLFFTSQLTVAVFLFRIDTGLDGGFAERCSRVTIKENPSYHNAVPSIFRQLKKSFFLFAWLNIVFVWAKPYNAFCGSFISICKSFCRTNTYQLSDYAYFAAIVFRCRD